MWVGRGRGPQGSGKTSRQRMKSGLGQAGSNEQWAWPEPWGQHRVSLECSNRVCTLEALPPIHARPAGRELTSE